MSILLVPYLFGVAFAVVFVGYAYGMDEIDGDLILVGILLSFVWPLTLLIFVGILIANAKVKK